MSDVFKHTFITLIPKTKNAHDIIDFRPFSLYSTFYKVIAKVLASRVKLLLLNIIHIAQSTFIFGKYISDNIVLAHDLCGNLSQNEFIAKVDLQKAFDSIN